MVLLSRAVLSAIYLPRVDLSFPSARVGLSVDWIRSYLCWLCANVGCDLFCWSVFPFLNENIETADDLVIIFLSERQAGSFRGA